MKRISIVFAETDDKSVDKGQGFTVFLEGITKKDRVRLSSTPKDNWTAAEFWALSTWSIVMDMLRRTGVSVKEEKPT
jgi:hypothetical protein